MNNILEMADKGKEIVESTGADLTLENYRDLRAAYDTGEGSASLETVYAAYLAGLAAGMERQAVAAR